MSAQSLREVSLPRLALRRDEAAAALGLSVGTFDKWVKDDLLPRGHKIGGVVLWDMSELSQAWYSLRDGVLTDGDNPFDGVVA
ncbi:hypothetical protein Brsp07_03019 [Brucella sp. NBRC 14130]|uniref:helix-turn-helix transcriptional regulator n=1 Tax=Brucella sp. NBRC 14130 TaxID=3075483 RepID=UPI00309D935F